MLSSTAFYSWDSGLCERAAGSGPRPSRPNGRVLTRSMELPPEKSLTLPQYEKQKKTHI